MDKLRITTVPDLQKVVAKKGQRQVGQMVSVERRELVTMAMAISADGNKIPPFFIFPRKKFKDFMVEGCVEGNTGDISDSGWPTEVTFLNWIKHFCHHTKPTKNNPVLLLLDNHCSHETYAALKFAKEMG